MASPRTADATVNEQWSESSDTATYDDVRVKDESDADESTDDDGDDGGGPLHGFEAKMSLPDAKIETRTLENLMDLLDKEAVVLNPKYQREVVWDRNRMAALIDSLIENYYVPPILFNKRLERDKSGTNPRWRRICVDGKQRLSSIKAFMQGKIPCHDRKGGAWYFTKELLPDGTLSKPKARRILPNDFKDAFRKKVLICYEYPDLRPIQEEDLFARVQKGVQLSPAEKLRATTGPWQEFAKLYERDFHMVVKLATTKRNSGFTNVLIAFSMIMKVQQLTDGGQPRFTRSSQSLAPLIQDKKALDPALKEHFRKTFMKFKELAEKNCQTFQDNGYEHAKLFAPVELVACAVLISKYKDTRNNDVLLHDIRNMRNHLRQHRRDLRMNADTWKVAWEFIEKLGKRRTSSQPDNADKGTPAAQPAAQPASKKPRITPKSVATPRLAAPASSNRGHAASVSSSGPPQPAQKPTPATMRLEGEQLGGIRKRLNRFTVSTGGVLSPQARIAVQTEQRSMAPTAQESEQPKRRSPDSVVVLASSDEDVEEERQGLLNSFNPRRVKMEEQG